MPLSSGIILSASRYRWQWHSVVPTCNMLPLRTEQERLSGYSQWTHWPVDKKKAARQWATVVKNTANEIKCIRLRQGVILCSDQWQYEIGAIIMRTIGYTGVISQSLSLSGTSFQLTLSPPLCFPSSRCYCLRIYNTISQRELQEIASIRYSFHLSSVLLEWWWFLFKCLLNKIWKGYKGRAQLLPIFFQIST